MNTKRKRKFFDELKHESFTYKTNLKKRIQEIDSKLEEALSTGIVQDYWRLIKRKRELEKQERKLTRY